MTLGWIIEYVSVAINTADTFLKTCNAEGTANTPQGRLFSSIMKEPLAVKCLEQLSEKRNRLSNICQDLGRHRGSCTEIRRIVGQGTRSSLLPTALPEPGGQRD